jgi:hypothetical protein
MLQFSSYCPCGLRLYGGFRKNGLKDLPIQYFKARYALTNKNIVGFSPLFEYGFSLRVCFNSTKNIKKNRKELLKNNLIGPCSLAFCAKNLRLLMFAVNENRTKNEIAALV